MRDAKNILAAAVGAGQSAPFFVPQDESVSVWAVIPMDGATKATLQITNDDGTTWTDALTGATPETNELSATTTIIQVSGPGLFRIDKEATTASIGIWLAESSKR